MILIKIILSVFIVLILGINDTLRIVGIMLFYFIIWVILS